MGQGGEMSKRKKEEFLMLEYVNKLFGYHKNIDLSKVKTKQKEKQKEK